MVIKKIIILSAAAISLLISGWLLIDSRNESISLRKITPTLVSFEQTEIDMGKLEQGKPQSASFQFKNIKEHPLVIQNVEASCGCTEPEWNKRPIMADKSSEIKVTYDAKYLGHFIKTIKVFCNNEKESFRVVAGTTYHTLNLRYEYLLAF